MVYKTEDTMYGYKVVFVCKKDKTTNLYRLLKIPECLNVIYAIIKIEIPKGTTIIDPWGQKINDDSGYHKLRCESAKIVKAVKYCYAFIGEKNDESFTNDNILELNFNATIDVQLIEVSKKKVIKYNKSKDIDYCSIYTFTTHFSDELVDSDILKLNDFMVAYPYLDTDDNLTCAPGIHFFKTEKEVYNYLVCLYS